MNDRWIPARAGDALMEVDTPALILDLNRFEGNLARLMSAVQGRGVRVRPHAKSHKCVEIARRQIVAGAIGICCQKTSEAEPFLAGGIADVLISNEVVGERKTRRLAQLAAGYPGAKVGVCVDDLQAVNELTRACEQARAKLDVYIELDVGHDRAGVTDAAAVVALGHAVDSHPSLSLRGLHAYFGNAQHRRSVAERREAIAAATASAQAARSALLAVGLRCDVITGAGTGTFMLEAGSGVYNEIQPGSYVMMDADYAKNEHEASWPAFEQSLMVLTTVMSRRNDGQSDRATLDAGLKSFSTDSGPALPAFAGWQVRAVSDEHTVLERNGVGPDLLLGDKVPLIPGHIDPTVNLHDWIVAARNNRVEAVWPIDARGAIF
ncbi:MAG TPA: DSD1 family PLP-dependent enzyme [Burkholderiaceae bacterium]|nr:DSD1 family PLP-dependent enzyme [Burkholderiaceae bacterium]